MVLKDTMAGGPWPAWAQVKEQEDLLAGSSLRQVVEGSGNGVEGDLLP